MFSILDLLLSINSTDLVNIELALRHYLDSYTGVFDDNIINSVQLTLDKINNFWRYNKNEM